MSRPTNTARIRRLIREMGEPVVIQGLDCHALKMLKVREVLGGRVDTAILDLVLDNDSGVIWHTEEFAPWSDISLAVIDEGN